MNQQLERQRLHPLVMVVLVLVAVILALVLLVFGAAVLQSGLSGS